MKTLLALLLLCLPVCAQTVNVTLTWDADSDPDVASYIVSSGGFVDFTTENEITLELQTGVYPFEVVAVDTRGVESLSGAADGQMLPAGSRAFDRSDQLDGIRRRDHRDWRAKRILSDSDIRTMNRFKTERPRPKPSPARAIEPL
jgi:hypothetical protein